MEEALRRAMDAHQQGRLSEAVKAYRALLAEHGEQAYVLYLLGVATYNLENWAEAAEVLARALQLNPTHAPTACCLGHVLCKQGDSEKAQTAYAFALQIKPDYTEALCHLAELLESMGERAEAKERCLQWHALEPDNAQPLLALARLAEAENNAEDVQQWAKGALDLRPNDPEALCLMGSAALAREALEEAEALYRKALEQQPQNPFPHYYLGVIFYRQKKYAWALGAFQTTLTLKKDLLNAHLMRGKTAVQLRRYGIACEHFEHYLHNGGEQNAGFHYFYGETLRNKDRLREAIVHLQKALLENPQYADAYVSLGHAFRKQEKFKLSLESLHKALSEEPDLYDAIFGLSLTYRDFKSEQIQEHMSCALKYALRAVEMKPLDAGAQFNLANVYMDLGLPERSIGHYRTALDNDHENPSSESSCCFNTNYLSDLPREVLFAQHQRWGERFVKPKLAEACAHANLPDPRRRLKLGFISPDLCVHPVAYFFRPVFEAIDRTVFETFLFYNNFGDRPEDEFTRAFKASAEHWHEIKGKDHRELADFIHSLGIDILVDLAGHSCGHKLLAMAYKPAPIQATWLGYPNTTGSPAIDYRICDPVTDPLADAAIHTETLLPLHTGFNCYRMPYRFPEPATELPAARNGFITFGSFNNTCKHNAPLLRLWARLLKEVPSARIAFKDKFIRFKEAREHVLEHFAHEGVGAERVDFLGFSETNYAHLERYADLDIALDPHPYNGTTTTCEALLMGVPVLTRRGDRHASRVSASILSRLGLRDWIAENEEDFIRIGIEKAKDLQALAELRTSLRTRMLASPVCNGELVAQELGEALRGVWQQWCSSHHRDLKASAPDLNWEPDFKPAF